MMLRPPILLLRRAASSLRSSTYINILALIVLTVSLVSRHSRAEAVLVLLVRPQTQSAIARESITRIRGELVADGFEVSVVDAPPGAHPIWVLARVEQQTNAAATVGLFLRTDGKAAEVWVVDRLTSKTVMRTIDLSTSLTGSAPEVLARRSVELLRASLLEVLVNQRERTVAPSGARDQASHWAERALEPRQSQIGVEAGALVLASFDGIGSSLMPVARVRFSLIQRLAARLTLSGLGTRPRIESTAASATVGQELGLLELVGEITPRAWLTPFVSLGAGVYHIGVDGSASQPYVGLRGDRFAFAVDAGAGLSLSITRSFALSLEGHMLLVTPYPVIRALEVSVAEVGNPLVSGALTLTGWL